MPEDQKKLLERYFSGNCSEEEKEIIERLFLSEKNNPKLKHFLKEIWEKTRGEVKTRDFDDSAYRSVLAKIKVKPKRDIRKWYAIAASLVVIIASLAYTFYLNSDGPGVSPALTYITVSTEKGEQKNIKLPDGTIVKLNYESTLTYPENFDEENRRVQLVGEGFFEVSDSEGNFKVDFADHYVKGDNTHFNIQAYANDSESTVSLTAGTLNVGGIGSKDILYPLQANESLHISKDATFKKERMDSRAVLAWKEGNIYFKNTGLSEVLTSLSRKYRDSIVLKPNGDPLPKFTINIKSGYSLEQILETLSLTKKITYKRQGKIIIVTPKE
ncbi:FecR family protein [Zunongwangia pacifica]|uniref:DUF4974 domain-containing protein n=1 Tax=Zunongwangia pacifica TaxID=2911062 RepID=A0A9X2CKQ0_9FLAO|nr:DUF4974 domain-containing protein [Zunongwangia pacifica]